MLQTFLALVKLAALQKGKFEEVSKGTMLVFSLSTRHCINVLPRNNLDIFLSYWEASCPLLRLCRRPNLAFPQ